MGVSSIILALDSRPYSLNRLKKKKQPYEKLRWLLKSRHSWMQLYRSICTGNREDIKAVSYIPINIMQLCSELSRLGQDYSAGL